MVGRATSERCPATVPYPQNDTGHNTNGTQWRENVAERPYAQGEGLCVSTSAE